MLVSEVEEELGWKFWGGFHRRVSMRACIENLPASWAVFKELATGRTACGLAAVFGVGLVSGVFGAGGRWFRCLTW